MFLSFYLLPSPYLCRRCCLRKAPFYGVTASPAPQPDGNDRSNIQSSLKAVAAGGWQSSEGDGHNPLLVLATRQPNPHLPTPSHKWNVHSIRYRSDTITERSETQKLRHITQKLETLKTWNFVTYLHSITELIFIHKEEVSGVGEAVASLGSYPALQTSADFSRRRRLL